VFELRNIVNHVDSLTMYLNAQRHPYILIAFSLGCVLVMKSLQFVKNSPSKIVLINPSNIVIDTCVNQRPYEWFWRLPKIIQNMVLYQYNRTVSKRLEEPPYLMSYIISKPFEHWNGIVTDINRNFSWVESVNNIRHKSNRIHIISGKNDRYHKFAMLLQDMYPETFSLKVVPGQHHIIYNDFESIAYSIRTLV